MLVVYFLELPLLAIPSLLACLILFTILQIFFGRRESVAKASEPKLSDEDMLLRDILFEMENAQLFLRKGLTLTELAQLVASNRSYVSGCINDNTGLSFSDFVNSYRVRYAQALLQWNTEGLTISEIRDKSGFETESTFIRNFKKFTGCTPSEWQASHSTEKAIS